VSDRPRAAATPAARHLSGADVALLAGGAALTVLVTVTLTRRPLEGMALLAVLAAAALAVVSRRRLARIDMGALLVVGLVLLPATALLGPSFALPGYPQAFLFRIVLALVIGVGVAYLIVRRAPLPFAASEVVLPLVLWFAWLFIGLTWSGDKARALDYIAIVFTMIALVLATAAAGGSRRRLRWLFAALVLAYCFVVGFTLLEARTGIRLPTSRFTAAAAGKTYAVTSVFVNQNDLATYLAFCWPFMLAAFFFTRKARWLVLDLLLMVIGAAAFVRTGSRSSLVAVGVSTVAAIFLFRHLSARLSTRSAKIAGTVIAVVLVACAAYLLFNDSQDSMLRQFRLEALVSQAQKGKGSGDMRANLTTRGLEIAGGSFLLGAGPGQAESIISSGPGALGIANLHNWWLETFADGGLVGFTLHLVFFLFLVFTLWPIARNDPDDLTRYLASATVLALIGWTIGAVGPSSSVGFAPIWILFGLALAVISRSRLAAAERRLATEEAAPARAGRSAADGGTGP